MWTGFEDIDGIICREIHKRDIIIAEQDAKLAQKDRLIAELDAKLEALNKEKQRLLMVLVNENKILA